MRWALLALIVYAALTVLLVLTLAAAHRLPTPGSPRWLRERYEGKR